MSVVKIPDEVRLPDELLCALCDKPVDLEDASAGPVGEDGEQLFIHARHFYRIRDLINGLVNFSVAHRLARTVQELSADEGANA